MTSRGRFLSNTLNPSLPEARLMVEAQGGFSESAWRDHLSWINANVIGPPRSCAAGTSEEMSARGYVGIYKKVEG